MIHACKCETHGNGWLGLTMPVVQLQDTLKPGLTTLIACVGTLCGTRPKRAGAILNNNLNKMQMLYMSVARFSICNLAKTCLS